MEVDRRQFTQSRANAGVASTLPDALETGADPQPLNILYLHSHDSGRFLQPYGHPIPTPHLNRLARQGVLFRQAFSAAPTCAPSRAALLTGSYPHQNGMLGLAHLGFGLHDYQQHILHTLKPAGYLSILAGTQHIAAKPETIGYDVILRPESMRAADVAPAAVHFLKSSPQQPFFLDVGFFETHRIYPEPTDQDDPNYVAVPPQIPDTAATRRDMAGYHASARLLDTGVGLILDALDELGLSENTLVISTTDHGIAFPKMKCSLSDAGCGVSLIMRGPGAFKAGTVQDAMVSHLDIFPTLCDLVGIEKPDWLMGKSLLPLLHGEVDHLHEALFAEVSYHAAYEPKRCVRTTRWKYVRRYDGGTTPVLPNCDDSPSKQLWLAHGWQTEPLEHPEELYDLLFDPAERNNLAADPAHHDTLLHLRSRLETWMRETNDPLLKGPIPAPPGSKTTPVNEINPRP